MLFGLSNKNLFELLLTIAMVWAVLVLLVQNKSVQVLFNQIGGDGAALVGGPLSFSHVTKDISDGNPISLSKKPNLRDRPDVVYGSNPVVTYWGHGMPLKNEIFLGQHYGQSIPTISGSNAVASPECCPSPYSTDQGCVCYRRHRNITDPRELGGHQPY